MMSETTFNGRGIQTFLSREQFPERDRNMDVTQGEATVLRLFIYCYGRG